MTQNYERHYADNDADARLLSRHELDISLYTISLIFESVNIADARIDE